MVAYDSGGAAAVVGAGGEVVDVGCLGRRKVPIKGEKKGRKD